MRRSASLLQGMVDMVCSKKRLVWQLERCGFSLTVDDSMVDLGNLVAAQTGATLKKGAGHAVGTSAPPIRVEEKHAALSQLVVLEWCN